MRGKVKWFNNKNGYGFIVNEDGDDIFVHYSDIVSKNKFKKLNTNDEVIFDIYVDEHDLEKAVNVQLIDKKNKAYIVYESWNTCDDSSPIAIFLDEKKCDDFIREKNRDWKEDDRKQDECTKCRGCDKDGYGDPKENTFKLKDICGRANIGTDRYGMYCEMMRMNTIIVHLIIIQNMRWNYSIKSQFQKQTNCMIYGLQVLIYK